MARYLLRAVKQVVVLELTGEESVIEAETEQQLHLAARKFLVEKFPDAQPGIEIEIKKLEGEVERQKLPDDFQPKNKAKFTPEAPF